MAAGNRPFLLNAAIALAGVALLAGLAWWLGPLLPALEDKLPRLTLIGVMLAAWAGTVALTYARQRAREAALSAGLLSQDGAAEEAGVLRGRFADAIALLRKTGGPRALQQLPWYAIIGPPGAGKTTALLNAGLSFPLAEGFGQAPLPGVGGTRNCDWWFTDTAVLIDTAGRYTTQDSDDGVDRAGWSAFLGLLGRTRPRQPLNGVLVAIPAVEIASAPAGLRTAHARAIRDRLTELDTALKTRLPVYVLFTKADMVAGFTEFFDDLDAEARRQVWGTTFPLDSRRGGAEPDTAASLAALIERLDGRLLPRLQAERSPERRALIAGFPAQVASLAEPLTGFLAETFGGSKLRPAPLLRGFYFTSGTQSGTPVDRLTATLAHAFGVSTRRAASLRPEQGRSYFLHRLLAAVLPGEAMLVATGPGAVRRRILLRGGGFAATALAMVAGGAVLWRLHAASLDEQARTGAALDRLAQEAARHPLDPVADTDAALLLPLLDGARDMPFAQASSASSLLDQTGALSEIGRTVHRQALERTLLPRLIRRLEGQIAASLNQPEFCYEATRIYLMLGGEGPLDAGLVRAWMQADWAAVYGGPGLVAAREDMLGQLDALLAAPLPAVPLDGALVDRARTAFAAVSPAARIYGRIRGSAAALAAPSWVPRGAMGPVGSALFIRDSGQGLEEGVPGFFTPTGFYGVLLPALGPAIRAVAAESWVLGAGTGLSGDPARLGRLEDDVMALYRANFFRTWDGLLDDLQLAPMKSVSRAAQDLYILASPQSPFRSLLTAVVQQVTLPAPGGAAASGWQRDTAGLAAAKPAAAIAAHYRPLQDLVGTGAGAPIDRALRSLTDLQQLLAKMAAAPVDAPPPAAAGNGSTQALLNEIAGLPQPLVRWLKTLADSAAALRSPGPK